ncbi:MAG: 4Fe-4S dicluster domain-containing protein [Deltaproteobacteria bacterium]|nr:4Fe-4S dicluster domain-containing protein [Deltaproteobacteria bacterium]
MSDKTLVVIPDNCIGCKTCMAACSMKNGSTEQLARPRIRIYNGINGKHVQVTCLQCVDPACVLVCDVHALVRNEKTGAIAVNFDRCIGCGLCETACPYGNIYFDRTSGHPEKCDLCNGDPACAKFCPHEALIYE